VATVPRERRVVVLGAGGRDFHDFAMVLRDDPAVRVVAFTAAQIPGIDHRRFPASLAGPRYPDGIAIVPEAELRDLVAREHIDEVVLAYSDLRHVDVMHLASTVMAAGADFRLLGPRATSLRSSRPVLAVCASRTGAGKSPTSRFVCRVLRDAGWRVALVRHPMPYGDLEAMRVQRFTSQADIDAADPTIEEREEYETPVAMGVVTWAGVDYAAIFAGAEREADVIVWDGGNNDFPFVAPDLLITVVDPLRAGDELLFHPGETCVRLADVLVVNKADRATADELALVHRNLAAMNPAARVIETASPVTITDGPSLDGARVLVVEDGPTLTHGGMAYGAGVVAAQQAGAVIVDPRPYAVGRIAEVFVAHPQVQQVLPAVGYGAAELADLEATIRAVPCDVVLAATPIDLARLVDVAVPIRRVTYEIAERVPGSLREVIDSFARLHLPPRG
jgi:predicted GTPase